MGAILRIFRMLFGRYPGRLALGYGSVCGAAVSALAIPQLIGRGVDRVLTDPDGGTGALAVLAGGLALAGLARGFFSFGQTYLGESLAQRIGYDLRNQYFDKLQHLSFAFHDKQATGELMSRATADVEAVRMFVNMGAVRAGFVAAIIIGVSVAMLLTDVRMALVSLAFVPFLAWRSVVTGRSLRRTWLRVQELTANMVAVLQEDLSGIRVVKAFGAEDHQKRKFHRASRVVADTTFLAESTWARNFAVMNFGFMLSLGAIVWYGGHLVMDGSRVVEGRITPSGLTPGDLTAFLFYMSLLFMPVRMIGWTVNNFARAASAGQRIFEVLDMPSPVREKPDAVDLSRVRGRVTFTGVTFAYDGFAPAIRDVSVDVAPGTTVALVGRPGSGKTTFAHLIPRYYDVSRGRLLLDGVDVRDVTLPSLRRNVGVVQQDVFIHTASIRDNVAYGNPDAEFVDVVRATQAAQLHQFVDTLPDSYDTVVGERGVGLSGGQKQRLSIARTILLDPPILILDDSTSSVDVETERRIQAALQEVARGRTTFVITNRFTAISRADLVLVFKDGRIIQRGSHAQLLAEGGEYRQLYESQVRPHPAHRAGAEKAG